MAEQVNTEGVIVTEVRCPQCGLKFHLDGNADREVVECPDCMTELYVVVK